MVSTPTHVNPEVLPSSHLSSDWGVNVFSWKSKMCCTAKAAENPPGSSRWSKKKDLFDIPPTIRTNLAVCKGNGDDAIVAWSGPFSRLCDGSGEGNKLPGNIIPPVCRQVIRAASWLSARTRSIHLTRGYQEPATQHQHKLKFNLCWTETSKNTEVKKSGAQRRCGEFGTEPNPHSALTPSNIRQKPAPQKFSKVTVR